jgi:hypothetical protein
MIDGGLCPNCAEVTDGHHYHPSCCGHDTVEDQEPLFGHQLGGWCADCGSMVYLAPPEGEDGRTYWEVME